MGQIVEMTPASLRPVSRGTKVAIGLGALAFGCFFGWLGYRYPVPMIPSPIYMGGGGPGFMIRMNRRRGRRPSRRVSRNGTGKTFPYVLDEAADFMVAAQAALGRGSVDEAHQLTQKAESAMGRATSMRSSASGEDLDRERRLGYRLVDLYGKIANRRSRSVSANGRRRTSRRR
jgi:hypothetical protein